MVLYPGRYFYISVYFFDSELKRLKNTVIDITGVMARSNTLQQNDLFISHNGFVCSKPPVC